ncbi:MAG: crotonase/enoyl-CoA hydratase family protein [Aestuariivita sp.]|nr:crotonase/enoyl-CoA hydratase family protein [Aestuariivita sp.]
MISDSNYSYETIHVQFDQREIAKVCLNRPDKHNAMSEQMLDELHDAARQIACDRNVRAVILAAEGFTFCAGADLTWMQRQIESDSNMRAEQAAKVANMLNAVNSIPKPVIGAVHGNAFGGGVGLIAVCDIAIGVEGLKIGLTEVRLGLIPATIGPYVVARIGEANARRIFLNGRLFDTKTAVNLGLFSYSVTREKLDEAVNAEINSILECAPEAIGEAKQFVRKLGLRIDDKTIAMSIDALKKRWETDEASIRIDAFLRK